MLNLERSSRRMSTLIVALTVAAIVTVIAGIFAVALTSSPATSAAKDDSTEIADAPAATPDGNAPMDNLVRLAGDPKKVAKAAQDDCIQKLEANSHEIAWEQRSFFEAFPGFEQTDSKESMLQLASITAGGQKVKLTYDGKPVALTVIYHDDTCSFEVLHTFDKVTRTAKTGHKPFLVKYALEAADGSTSGEIHRPDSGRGCTSANPPGFSGEDKGQQILMVSCQEMTVMNI